MRNPLLLLITLSLSGLPLSAADLSLKDALDLSMQNSPKVQRSKSAKEEASWKRVEAFSTYLPTVSAGATYLTNKRYMLTDIQLDPNSPTLSIPAIIPTMTYELKANYVLFDGLASTNRYLAAKAMERAAEREDDWARFQTEREVTLQFYRALGSKILKEVAEQNVKNLEDHLKDTGLFKKAGISTNYDVLRVEVQVSEARSEVMNSEDNIEVSSGRLAEMMGQTETPQIAGSLPALEPSFIQRLTDPEISSRPDLQAIQERVQGLDDLSKADSRHWVPRISVYGVYDDYNNRTDSYNDFDKFREAYQVGLNLTWNLFDGFASTAKAHESVEAKFQAEKSLQAAQLKARQDLNFWKRKYLYFCNVYKARLSDVEKSKETVRLAKEGRRVGARTNTDLLDAESELYRSQAGAVNAQLGAIEALINLELATGQKLYQFN